MSDNTNTQIIDRDELIDELTSSIPYNKLLKILLDECGTREVLESILDGFYSDEELALLFKRLLP